MLRMIRMVSMNSITSKIERVQHIIGIQNQKKRQQIEIKEKKRMSTTGELSFELYKWLSSLQIIISGQKYKSNGNIQLDSKIYQELLSGQLMAKLAEILSNQLHIQLNLPLLSSIKKSNTPASRVYNWNVLNETYAKIGILLSKQMQKEITSGNFQELKRFLIQIQRKMAPKKIQKSQLSKQEPSDGLDFAKIQKYSSYQDCQNVLQTIIKIITKTCALTAKQAFSTLAQNLKYFSHMIVKGIKNSYDEIQSFFKTIVQTMPHLMYLAEKDPARNTSFLLQILKPSLISRQPQVALCGSKALYALIYESMKYNGKNLIYQILSGQHAGFDFIYMGLKRHPHLVVEYIGFIHPLIENTYKEFFEVHLKNIINNEAEYIKTVIILLEGIKQTDESRKNVVESGMLKNWVKMCEEIFNLQVNRKQLQQNGAHTLEQAKISALQLVCDLWKIYSAELNQEQAEQLLMRGIEQLKRNTRKDNYLVKVSAFHRLFDFLDFLANSKNRLASIVYKKTIFLLFQNYQELELRQVILQNFILIFKKFPTIPLEFLLEPLLRQLIKEEGISYILNVFDFEFFIQIFRHPKIQSEYALAYLEYFTKLYTKNIIYSGIVIRIIELLCSRFCEEDTIMEYIIKNVQNSLNTYGMLVLGKKTYLKGREQRLMNSQKKSLVIELLKYYIKLENQFISTSIKSRVLKLYVNWIDTKNHNDKGLYYLLSLFGQVDEMEIKERIQKQNQKLDQSQLLSSGPRGKNQSERERMPITNSASYSTPKVFTPLILDSPFAQRKSNDRSQVKDWRQDTYIESVEYNSEGGEFKPRVYKKAQKSQKLIKPKTVDQKTLEDIQIYKQRKRRQSQKQRLLMERTNEPQVIPKINYTELMQRQISLGYNKMVKPEQLFYQIDSVKTKYLKQETQMIELEDLEQRDILSTHAIFKRYEKQIQTIFYKYTAVGSINNRSPTQEKVFMSFTDLNRMLKEKQLNKLPKIVINQIITFINRRKKYNINVLVGVEQKQFNQFLILFTNLYLKQDRLDKDEPFGFKIQKILIKMFEGQWLFKELTDKKANDWFNQNNVQETDSQQQEILPVPEGYKKIVNEEALQIYRINNSQEFMIPQNYQACIEVLNEIFLTHFKINLFPAITELKKVTRICPTVKAPKPKISQINSIKNTKILHVMTQKAIKKSFDRSLQSNQPLQISKASEFKPSQFKTKLNSKNHIDAGRSKSQKEVSNKKINKPQMLNSDQIKKKHKQQEEYAKKLRDQLQLIKKAKQQKDEEQKQKKQLQQNQKIKKQQKHKKYLEENKRKIQQKKQKQLQQKKQKQAQEHQEFQKNKALQKEKEKELLQKMQKHIQEKKQKFQDKQKSKENQLKRLQNIKQKAKNQIISMEPNAEKQKQKRLIEEIASGKVLMPVINNYEPQVKILFEEYWNWKTKKIELKEIALMMKNFNVSPEYLPPKLISQTYKVHAKGDALAIDQFKHLLIKYCYKSEKLKQQTKINTGKQFEPQQLRNFLEQKLAMKSFNYVETIKKAKLQKL